MAAASLQRLSDLRMATGRLPGFRVLGNDRFTAAMFGLLAFFSTVRSVPGPEWFSVELHNYAWALDRLVTSQRIYSVPLPNNPLNPGAHYTPPPFSPLLGGQFADTPVLWGIINVSAMVLGVYLAAAASGALAGRHPLRAATTALVAVLIFGPAVTVVLLGNQQGFVLLALGGAWWLERRHPAASGVALAAAALLKLFPGMLLARTIARGHWRKVVSAVATTTVVIVVSAVLLGPQRYVNFLHNLIDRAQPAFDQDFNLAPATILDSIPATAVILLVGVFVIARSGRRDRAAVSFGRAIIVSLVVWPVSWYQYASIALIAAAATLDRRTWRWLALSLFLFSIANPLTWLAAAAVGWIGMGRFGEVPENVAPDPDVVTRRTVAAPQDQAISL
jgi:Glycosyltransferase family 87